MNHIVNFTKKHEINLTGRQNALYESSLSRIYTHANSNGFFLMSAFRGNLSDDENMKRHKSFMQDVRGYKLGFIEVYGKWVENKGTKDEKLVSELSLFVPYRKELYSLTEFWEIATSLMVKYNQDAIVYRETKDEEVWIVDQDQDVAFTIGKFVPDKIADIYSELKKGSHRGRKFIFESVLVPNNHVSALKMQKSGYIL